jgi:hypothetical protein
MGAASVQPSNLDLLARQRLTSGLDNFSGEAKSAGLDDFAPLRMRIMRLILCMAMGELLSDATRSM